MSASYTSANNAAHTVGQTVISPENHALATTLMNHMGYEKAHAVCRNNQWHGVLDALLALKN